MTMDPSEAADLDRILDGHAVLSAGDKGPTRGAVDDSKLTQLVRAARDKGRQDLADACHAASGCALRNQDLQKMTADDVNLDGGVVLVLKHDSSIRKAKTGSKDERPIATSEAYEVLERRIQTHPKGPLWPKWNRIQANEFVKAVAEEQGWPKNLRWDGIHCVGRHGAAIRAKKAAIEAIKKVGAWKSDAAATSYGRIMRK
jgi:hypothetical protein